MENEDLLSANEGSTPGPLPTRRPQFLPREANCVCRAEEGRAPGH